MRTAGYTHHDITVRVGLHQRVQLDNTALVVEQILGAAVVIVRATLVEKRVWFLRILRRLGEERAFCSLPRGFIRSRRTG